MMDDQINDTEYRELLETARTVYGYDFTDYNELSVKRRIRHFMENRGIATANQLNKLLVDSEGTFVQFVQDLQVTVTEMFRDPLFFKCIREKVVKRMSTYPFIKIWIAGCATGEEVYSMAILLKEEGLLDRSLIYATDINQKSLQTARDGIYPILNMKEYTESYIQSGGKRSFSEYYIAKYERVMFDKQLRQNVVFAYHNLVTDKSFNEFQFIICRNVLMYFNGNLRDKVMNLFYDSLCNFGFLGLGDKESLMISDAQTKFSEIDKKEKIYMKMN